MATNTAIGFALLNQNYAGAAAHFAKVVLLRGAVALEPLSNWDCKTEVVLRIVKKLSGLFKMVL